MRSGPSKTEQILLIDINSFLLARIYDDKNNRADKLDFGINCDIEILLFEIESQRYGPKKPTVVIVGEMAQDPSAILRQFPYRSQPVTLPELQQQYANISGVIAYQIKEGKYTFDATTIGDDATLLSNNDQLLAAFQQVGCKTIKCQGEAEIEMYDFPQKQQSRNPEKPTRVTSYWDVDDALISRPGIVSTGETILHNPVIKLLKYINNLYSTKGIKVTNHFLSARIKTQMENDETAPASTAAIRKKLLVEDIQFEEALFTREVIQDETTKKKIVRETTKMQIISSRSSPGELVVFTDDNPIERLNALQAAKTINAKFIFCFVHREGDLNKEARGKLNQWLLSSTTPAVTNPRIALSLLNSRNHRLSQQEKEEENPDSKRARSTISC